MTGTGLTLHDGVAEDADRLTALFMESSGQAMPWLPTLYDAASIRSWMERVVLAGARVRVARVGALAVGFSAVKGDLLDHLYVDPDYQRQGVGRALLEDAKSRAATGLSLYVFTRNVRARRFYEAAGFVLVEERDGQDNEEREPDCVYSWSAQAQPTL